MSSFTFSSQHRSYYDLIAKIVIMPLFQLGCFQKKGRRPLPRKKNKMLSSVRSRCVISHWKLNLVAYTASILKIRHFFRIYFDFSLISLILSHVRHVSLHIALLKHSVGVQCKHCISEAWVSRINLQPDSVQGANIVCNRKIIPCKLKVSINPLSVLDINNSTIELF